MKPDGMTTGNLDRDLKNPIAATIAKTHNGWDLALVELSSSPANYPVLAIADSVANLGDRTFAIGHPEDGGAWSVTTGVVSNRLADFEQTTGKTVYQMQTPINPGNSGGPLLNTNGELIGVTTSAIRVGKSGHVTEGIQFAVASEVVRKFLVGYSFDRSQTGAPSATTPLTARPSVA
jgi:serine protease Do